MCGVFYMDDEGLDRIRSAADETHFEMTRVSWNRDIHPTEIAPVLTASSHGNVCLTTQRWGYPGMQGKGVIFNARAESVQEKPMFHAGICYHRAVIPASHFYEWNRNHEKNVFSGKDGRILYMAGFFDLKDNENRFVILTTAANASMLPVHDRMPLILEQGQVRDWLMDDQKTDYFLKQEPALLKRETEYEQLTLF